MDSAPRSGSVSSVPVRGVGEPAGALLVVRGPVSRRALRSFLRRLDALDGAPEVVVDDPAGAPAPASLVTGSGPALARSPGAGRVSPSFVLYVEGRRVWEHHGRRRSDVPAAEVVTDRARTLVGFRRADVVVARAA